MLKSAEREMEKLANKAIANTSRFDLLFYLPTNLTMITSAV